LRRLLIITVLLAVPGTALAAPSYEAGPYVGSVAVKGSPPVAFTATRKRVKELEVDSVRARCSDGATGALNLPDPTKRSAAVKKGRFEIRVKSGLNAGTRITGRLKGRRASGTIRIVLRRGEPGQPGATTCDTGKRKWTAKLDEIIVELP
jgi:hypothetical protein